MISDPRLIFYACISKGTTILAEHTSGDPDLEALALKFIEKTPPFHSVFSETFHRRTYTFLIDNPFVYFAIYDENLEKAQGLWFLSRVKDVFEDILESKSITRFDDLTSHCFQAELNPIFRELLALPFEFSLTQDSQNASLNSSKEKKTVSLPLLGKPGKGLKKKKRAVGESNGNGECRDLAGENKVVEVSDDGARDFSLSLAKNGLLASDGGRQKAKQKWMQQVWMVLLLDLVVCSLLFAIWLWICRGFKCIDG
ncbi:phytolongin Phyl2.2 [Malania oleifera]|uniref:phytolongin Phyl2.2 n=1 Tax=Malania oleifera TaxID=397392 RepID=UPI0025AE3C27|nr:phytolongin Phyl2.2 [Malania oleifera]XP_057951557.1 phytolongin Phyl2.2 [Malania oleifera]XP_057951558.1 phytolongin Phyl2.2 [Malania oleifera]